MVAASVGMERPVFTYGRLLTEQLERPRPLVAGIIDEGTGNIIAGPPGVGKTWLILSLARAVGSGTSWCCHFPTTQAPVLFFDEEGTLWGMQDRLQLLEAADPLRNDLPITFCIGHGVRLDTQAGVNHIEAMIAEHRPGLTIFDSLTRMHGADKNDAGAMAAVFAVAKALMRRYGTAILFTDHLRKKSLINDPEEMLRGSSEKRAWPESILFAAAGEPGRLNLTHIKSRYHEPLQPFSVAIDVDADAGTALVRHAGAVASSAVVKGNEIVAAIHELKRQLGDDGADATTVAAWLDCSDDTVRRHVGKLEKAGIIQTRKVAPSSKGGKSKAVYDVVRGQDA